LISHPRLGNLLIYTTWGNKNNKKEQERALAKVATKNQQLSNI
jgi:hypothetical protein